MLYKRLLGTVLAVSMLLSLLIVPGMAADNSSSIDETSFTTTDSVPTAVITTKEITSQSTELEVTLSNLPESGICRIIELDAGEDYESAKLNTSYTSLYFSLLSALKNGENTLTLSAKPTAGKKLLAVIRDATAEEALDYTSQSVYVAAAAEPSIIFISDQSITTASLSVTLSFTRVPSMGMVKLIQLEAGESFDAEKLNSYDALYTGYLFSGDLVPGDNTVSLSASPTAGRVLYAVVRDSSGTDMVDYISEGVTVTSAKPDFSVEIKGELTDDSASVSFLLKSVDSTQSSRAIDEVSLCRIGGDGSADTANPLSQLESQMADTAVTFEGVSGLSAGDKVCLVLRYDGWKTFTSAVFTVCDSQEEDSFRIVETTFTTESTTITVEVTGYNWYNNRGDWSKIWITTGSASQTSPGDDEGREDLRSQTFTGSGTYNFTIDPSQLKAGNSIMAALRFYDGEGIEGQADREYYAAASTVLISQADAPSKTWQEILSNCAVSLLKDGEPRTETFRQEQTTVDYAVSLDETIPSARLTIFAYSGNTKFDPDSNYTKRLGGATVKDGDVGTISVDLSEIPVGYKVIAGLYVCLDGNDFYRTVASPQALEIVDENGAGFQDYIYPNATIDEETLEAGATSLHISLTGDERLFQAAQGGKTSITVAVSQYPADEDFDFEGVNQISLLRNYTVTEAFSGKEITFADTPLRAGYRVRAVVYWSQNVDLFLPKGNDYEASFGRPDDSVLITSPAAVSLPGTILDTDGTIPVAVSGTVPEGTLLLLKQFDASADISYDKGTPVGVFSDVTDGMVDITTYAALNAGSRLAAFLVNGGEAIAQSASVVITTAPEFTIAFNGALTTETSEATITVTAKSGLEDTKFYIVGLCRVDAQGKTDITSPESYVARVFGSSPGTIQLTGISGLTAGERVRFVLRYPSGSDTKTMESADYIVLAPMEEDSLVIHEMEFTVNSTTATVTISGCDFYQGDLLKLTIGTPSTDNYADGRMQLGEGQRFTGSGTYTFTFDAAELSGGNTIQAYLYHYDAENDHSYYKYSNAVAIAKEAVEATVSVATQTVTTEAGSVYVGAQFDGTALLTLYTYSGDVFDPESLSQEERGSYVAIKYLPSAPTSVQKVDFIEGTTLTEGDKLAAVLWSGGISGTVLAQSQPVTIAAAPAREASVAYIRDPKITAGITRINVTMSYDSRVEEASYVLYQFTGETLDKEMATVLSSGQPIRNGVNTIYVGMGRLTAGSKLQLALITDGEETLSNVVTVLPSPDWGTPYVAFNVSAVQSGADSIAVSVDYADEYLSMGDDFYCDITIYTYPASYTDQQVEDNELWEQFSVCRSVAKINSTYGDVTKGELTIPIREGVVLTPGDRLIIKLRLPHTEWEEEEVDYVSASVPIIGDSEAVAVPVVLLYNLSEDTSVGRRLRTVLTDLGIAAVVVTDDQLGETVGYLAGLEGYAPAEDPYAGQGSDVEFMLMANLPEALLDRFLAAMTENGISIGNKAITTAYNVDYEFHRLIDDIKEEHLVFQALLELDDLIAAAETLSEEQYGTDERWKELQAALAAANATLSSYEPTLEELQGAIEALKAPYLAVSGLTEMTGTAIITAEKQADDTYTLRASVAGGALTDYIFTWNSGEVGTAIAGVPADKLVARKVTVTSPSALGTLTAQLGVPAAPKAAVTAGKDSVTICVTPPDEAANCMAPTEYLAELYAGGGLVASKTAADSSIIFQGLTASTNYTVKLSAVSPVGVSDKITMSICTTSGSGGSSGYSSFSVTVESTGHGAVTTSPKTAVPGSTVTVAVKPDDGYVVDRLAVADQDGGEIELTQKSDTEYTFSMPASNVTVKASFKEEAHDCLSDQFTDVDPDGWYHEALDYVIANGLMKGTGDTTFDPDGATSRAMIVTILWRLEGIPSIKESTAFLDVPVDAWYTDAVGWAAANSIVDGYGDETFGPDDAITREQMAAILYRYAAYKGCDVTARADLSGFADAGEIADWSVEYMEWANVAKLIQGTSSTTLSPANRATRAEAAAILMRFAEGVVK